ncbi:MAG TPA: Holliday junction resolvase RuvX [Dehalococcoidia bacterium]
MTRPALGLDVGERRVGVAVSDPERHLAVPLRSVARDGAIEALAALAREYEVADVVVGLPLTLRGEAGPQAESASAFARELERRLRLPVHLWDERLSTQEAQRRVLAPSKRRGRRERTPRPVDTDALAASIILQAYLDRQRLAQSGEEVSF